MNSTINSIMLIAVAAIVTLLLRAFPFIVFSGKRQMPKKVKKLVDLMPVVIMAVLVVYCIKDDIKKIIDIFHSYSLTSLKSPLAALLSIAGVAGIHLWKRNTILSIALGTMLYMILLRLLIKL